jgi:hypothetical protein
MGRFPKACGAAGRIRRKRFCGLQFSEEESMTKRKKAAMERGQATAEDPSRRGMGLFAFIAILTLIGVAIWLVVNSSSEPT